MSLPSGSALASSPSPFRLVQLDGQNSFGLYSWLPSCPLVPRCRECPKRFNRLHFNVSIKRHFDKGCKNWLISVDLNHRHRRASSFIFKRMLLSQNFASPYPSIAKALQAMPDETVIDGEVVALD
jgi:hypothetical protein